MAESRMFTDSFSNACDEYHDFPCSPCAKAGMNVSALKFCVECNELLCSTCLGHHNKFDIMKGHQLLDKTSSQGHVGGKKGDVPTLRCYKHDGKILDVFCNTHDEPCCVVCASVDHSSCPEKQYLPSVAKKATDTNKYISIKASAIDVKTRLEKAKQGKIHNLAKITNQKKSIFVSINEKREIINKRLDVIQSGVQTQLVEKFNDYNSELLEDIAKLGDFIGAIESGHEHLDSIQNNESDAFIVSKRLLKIKNSSKLETSLRKMDKSIALIETSTVSSMLEALDSQSFGYIVGAADIEYTGVNVRYSIKSAGDTSVCFISDSCLMDDGTIILVDQKNRTLKKLDNKFSLKDTLAVPGKPCAICPTGNSEVAISLLSNKTVQFASTTKPMSIRGSIAVEESCRGLAYNNGFLYMSCGGMAEFNDGNGEIRMYDKLSGAILGKVGNEILIPKRMAVNTDINRCPADIYVADEVNGVVCVTTNIDGIHSRRVLTHENLKSSVGICYAGRGQIVVCGYDSDNVMLISENGKVATELLTKKDGVQKPKTLCLDQTGSKLMIGMANVDYITVFDLARE